MGARSRHIPTDDHASATLIAALREQSPWPHPVSEPELIETHISWVFLTGDYAYKIKKPVDLGFLDFSTLERRRHFCEEEVRLNRHWAPELYLGVVPIGGTPERPVPGGEDPAIEYAVKMRQFPRGALLSEQLDAGKLSADDLRSLAETVAERHREAPRARIELVRSGRIRHAMMENFDHLAGLADGELLRGLQSWIERELERREPELLRRQKAGLARECHGDLHLRNLVRLDSGIVPFDCIEFSEELRSIDVMSDVAFLFMDLVERDRRDLAYVFLNRYLECSGDYDGIAILALYFVYHCLIRAKVLAIRHMERNPDGDADADLAEMSRYCRVAAERAEQSPAWLLLMHGYSGSGKTYLSEKLMAELPAIRIRSDIERKRLFGLAEAERSHSAVGRGLYGRRAGKRVYKRLLTAAAVSLGGGENVILDAAFLDARSRTRARKVANTAGVAWRIVDVTAPLDVLVGRLAARSSRPGEASEADVRVLEYQLDHAEPLTDEEWRNTLEVDSTLEDAPLRVLRGLERPGRAVQD